MRAEPAEMEIELAEIRFYDEKNGVRRKYVAAKFWMSDDWVIWTIPKEWMAVEDSQWFFVMFPWNTGLRRQVVAGLDLCFEPTRNAKRMLF